MPIVTVRRSPGRPRTLTPEEKREKNRVYQKNYQMRRRRRDRSADAQKAYEERRSVAVHATAPDHVRPPDSVLADREYRGSLQPSISQLLFGDPLPGYSALDRVRIRVS